MDREELRLRLKQRPFQPFRVILTDGRTFDVRYPRMNQLAHTFVKIGIPEHDGPDPMCDHLEYVPLAQIARIEPLPVAPPQVTS